MVAGIKVGAATVAADSDDEDEDFQSHRGAFHQGEGAEAGGGGGTCTELPHNFSRCMRGT